MILKVKDRKAVLIKKTETHLQFLNEIQIPGMDVNPEVSIAKILFLLRSVRAFKEEIQIVPHRYDVNTKEVLPITKELQAVATVSDESYCLYDVQGPNTVVMYDIPIAYKDLEEELKEQSLIPTILPVARVAQSVLSHLPARTMAVTLDRNYVEFTVIQETILHTERVQTNLSECIINLEGCEESAVTVFIKSYIDGTLEMPSKVSSILGQIYNKFEDLKTRTNPYTIGVIGPLSNVILFEDTEEYPLIKITPRGEWTEGLEDELVQEIQPLLFAIVEHELALLDTKKLKAPKKPKASKVVEPEEDYEDDYEDEIIPEEPKPPKKMRRTEPGVMHVPTGMENRVSLDGANSDGLVVIDLNGNVTNNSIQSNGYDEAGQYYDDNYDDGYDDGYGNGEIEGNDEYSELFQELQMGKNRKKGKAGGKAKPRKSKKGKTPKPAKEPKTKKPKKEKQKGKLLSARVIIVSTFLSVLIVGGIFFYYMDPLSLFNHQEVIEAVEGGQEVEVHEDASEEISEEIYRNAEEIKQNKIADLQELKTQLNLTITSVEELEMDEGTALAVEFTNITLEELDTVLSTLAGKYTVQSTTVDNGVIVYLI